MESRPPLLFDIAVAMMAIITTFKLYQVWFEPKKALARHGLRVYHLPNWHLFKWLAEDQFSDGKSWIKQNRIIYIFAEVCVLGILILCIWGYPG